MSEDRRRVWRREIPPLRIAHPALFDYPGLEFGPPCVCGRDEHDSIYSYGTPPAQTDVLLVGIAPGKNEYQWGVPMVGATGERSDNILRAVKYPRQKVHATNLVCFWNDTPTEEEIAGCWPRLKEEILTYQPKLIVALGGLASEWLTGYPLGKARGAMIFPQHNRSEHWAELMDEWTATAMPPPPVVMPTWHPAASLRVPSLATDILRDYRKIRPFLAGRLNPLVWDHEVVTDRVAAQRILDSLAGREVAIDVETEDDSTDSFQRIVCVAMAVRGDIDGAEFYHAWVFPVEVLRGLRWPKFKTVLEHNMAFDNPAIYREFGVWLPRVKDTMLWSWSKDERPGRDEEGTTDRARGGAKSAPRGPGYHGLKPLSAELCGAGPGYGDDIKKTLGKSLEGLRAPQEVPLADAELAVAAATLLLEAPDGKNKASKPKSRKSKAPTRFETEEEAARRFDVWWQQLLRYNAFDAVNTVALPGRLLGVGAQAPAFEKYVVPSAQMFARMHLWGVPVDVERARELEADWEPWISNLTDELQFEAFDYGYRNEPKLVRDKKARDEFELAWGIGTWMGEPINLNSFIQLGNFLYGTLRQRVTVRTPGGKPSTSKEAIQGIAHPFVARLMELQTAQHIKANHLDPILRLAHEDEAGWHRVHPSIWVNGAVSARRSITNPPLQQYPQEHPEPFWKRLAEVRSVVAPPPGYGLLAGDLKQVELWGAAILSGDPVFLADLQSNDYHTKQVRETFLCDEPEGTVLFKHMRLLAKRFNFSVIYKVERDTLAALMNQAAREAGIEARTTPEEADKLIRLWYRRNRVFKQWQEQLIRKVKREGKLTNDFGFVRRFPLYDSSLDKQIVNWPIQSTCGYFVVLAAMELEKPFRDFDAHLLFDTHDELMVECPIDARDDVATLMRGAMGKVRIAGWPQLGVEFSWSTESWRKMKPFELATAVTA